MTESIFAPFRLTDKESIEKAVKVLTSEPAPWPNVEKKYNIEYLDEKGVSDFFANRKMSK